MLRLGFIGAGNMAETIISGLRSKAPDAWQMSFYDPSVERGEYLTQTYGIERVDKSFKVYTQSDVVVLAAKPQQLDQVAGMLAEEKALDAHPLVISILAGTPLSALERVFGHDRVVRVMPNLAAQVAAAMSVLTPGDGVGEKDLNLAVEIFRTLGEAVVLSEDGLDNASAVNGCAPAFFFQMIEAASDALVMLGIGRKDAIRLSAQTMLGAAKLVLETGEHPAVLKDKVTSPAGTTIAGVLALEEMGGRTALQAAILASCEKNNQVKEERINPC